MIEIVRPSSGLEPAVTRFFACIDTEAIKRFFDPHPFTEAKSREICGYRGPDEYYFAVAEAEVLGYSMLRGWEEGYETPTLGICLHPKAHGQGLGRAMMHHLIACARRRQSAELMLKVKRDNTAAIALYRKLGFDLTPLDADNLRGKLRLKAIS